MKEHPIKSIRRAAVPIAAFETADPAATQAAIISALNGNADVPIWQWDVARGLQGVNSRGQESLADWYDPLSMGAVEAFTLMAKKAPRKTLCFCHNPQRHWDMPGFSQAIWNLRDAWKTKGATFILIGPPLVLPPELQQDTVVITEPLPDAGEVGGIVDQAVKTLEGAGAKFAQDFNKDKAVDILLGGSAFACEQSFFMASSPEGVDLEKLWSLKRKMIEQTPGLTVWRGKENFDSLGGLENLKTFLRRLLYSPTNPIRAIGFIDEIEKLFAASGSDLSGVSQDQLRVFLTAMQDLSIPGMILIGPPGTGKSAIAKAAGAEAGAEVLAIDTGAMTGSLVGESQAKIRKAMSVFEAVSQRKGMFIATCNKLNALPPELRRRFTLGTFFVDLPSAAERKAIWPIWLKAYGLDVAKLPDDKDWTGAEIRACCDVAYRTQMSLEEASQFIVPVAKSAPESIESLRKLASGRFISANNPGVYRYSPNDAPTGREVEF